MPALFDEDVDATPAVEGGVDDRLATFRGGDTVGVGDGLSAAVLDLLHGVIGGIAARSIPGDRAAEVVDDDACSALGEQERVLPAQPPACAGDDGDMTVEPQFAHLPRPFRQGVVCNRMETAGVAARAGVDIASSIRRTYRRQPLDAGSIVPEHAVEHRDDARQILGDEVGTDLPGLLSPPGEVLQRRSS